MEKVRCYGFSWVTIILFSVGCRSTFCQDVIQRSPVTRLLVLLLEAFLLLQFSSDNVKKQNSHFVGLYRTSQDSLFLSDWDLPIRGE
jgi:hypothetical protein